MKRTMLLGVLILFIAGCEAHLTKLQLDGSFQDYKLNEPRTARVGSTMLSRFVFKNSCYDYIAVKDYKTPEAGSLGAAVIKKGTQYPACLIDLSDPNSVFMQGVHTFSNISLRIQKDGFIGDNGGWYHGNSKNILSSWPNEKLFVLSDQKYFPGFDSQNQRLIYLGRLDGKIRIGYRSTSYNSSKPASAQDLIFNLKDGDIITCLNFTIKVLNADSSKISFIAVDE